MIFSQEHSKDVIFLLIVSFAVYALSMHPIDEDGVFRSVNSRSQYLITKSFVENGSFRLDPYINKTIPWNMDVAFFEGHYYSSKPPGISFLAIPFYIGGDIANDHFLHLSGEDKEIWLCTCVLLASSFLGALGITAIYGICMELGSTRRVSFLVSMIGAFGTILWVYSSTFFRHGPSASLLLMGFYFGFHAVRTDQKWSYLLCGVFLGYLILSEYAAIILIIPSILYFSSTRFSFFDGRKILSRSITIMIGVIPSIFLLMMYNFVNFGSPISFSYSYSSYANQILGAGPEKLLLELSFGKQIEHMLFMTIIPIYGKEDRALFFLTPVLLFSIFETLKSFKERDSGFFDNLFFWICFLLILAIYSRWEEWWGGIAYGPRQILVVIPLLLFPLANYLQRYHKTWEWGLFCVAVFFSVFTAAIGALANWDYMPLQNGLLFDNLYLREWLYPWFAPLIILILIIFAFFRALRVWKASNDPRKRLHNHSEFLMTSQGIIFDN